MRTASPSSYRKVLCLGPMESRTSSCLSSNGVQVWLIIVCSCRSCTSFASWAAMTKGQQQTSPFSTNAKLQSSTAPLTEPPEDCPPDVDRLGSHTWTFLHTLTANYPTNPSPAQQSDTKSFISLFSKMYPCWVCADDFRTWMKEGNEPRVSNREEFGRWMCEAHNAVNVKLGKEEFDCGKWEERWRTGWKDGRCD
jgi:mitochondrial FAD-linked sulfhydryl oxidase